MCGRYVQASSYGDLEQYFQTDEVRERAVEHRPDYNVAPTRDVPVVAVSEQRRVLDVVRWGLVPPWAKDLSIGNRMINARAESVATKPAYRKAFEKRRCIVPADGFYEWRRIEGRSKLPYYIRHADGTPLAFAGLWERWKDPDDPEAEWIRTCCIITTDANEALRKVHDRMPVVLPEASWEQWLDPDNHDTEALRALLVPAPAEEFVLHPVSTRVNRPANNDPSLLEEVPEPAAG
jgi:putative SOS response-associated peptidase YedK